MHISAKKTESVHAARATRAVRETCLIVGRSEGDMSHVSEGDMSHVCLIVGHDMSHVSEGDMSHCWA